MARVALFVILIPAMAGAECRSHFHLNPVEQMQDQIEGLTCRIDELETNLSQAEHDNHMLSGRVAAQNMNMRLIEAEIERIKKTDK